MVGLTPQLQTGVPGFPLSSWPPKLPMVAPPIDRGRMHDQQMSVIGFGKRPVQVAIDAPERRTMPGRAGHRAGI
jgi:hypothetical protein